MCRKRSDHLDWIAGNCLAGQQSGQTLLYPEGGGPDGGVDVATLRHQFAEVPQARAANGWDEIFLDDKIDQTHHSLHLCGC